jgi:hypothetical protein
MFFLSENKLHWNQETEGSYIKCLECPQHSTMCAFTLFLMFDQLIEEFLHASYVLETVHQTRYYHFVRHRRTRKCIPKLTVETYVRTRCQVALDSEHSLHLWKRHPCTSTVWRQLTDWREQVTTWRDLRRLLYSHSDTVCLLIQTNFTELHPSVNILI